VIGKCTSLRIGTVRSGRSITLDGDIGALSNVPSRCIFKACLLAEEINLPLRFEHESDVTGESEVLYLELLQKMAIPSHLQR